MPNVVGSSINYIAHVAMMQADACTIIADAINNM